MVDSVSNSGYINASGGCCAGHCHVFMEDNSHKKAKDIKKGDRVVTYSTKQDDQGRYHEMYSVSTIECVVKTYCSTGKEMMVKFGELCRLITTWEAHSDPIVLAGGVAEAIKPGIREEIVRVRSFSAGQIEYQVEVDGKKHNRTGLFKAERFSREIKPLKEVADEISNP